MTVSQLVNGLNKIIGKAGQQMRIIHFTETIGSVWDDELSLVESTNIWLSGLVFPLSSAQGTIDSLLLEQGKLQPSDKKIYLNGSIILTGSDLQTRIQIGSPSAGKESYELVADGGTIWDYNGQNIYKRAFIRRLTIGSLIGE